MTETGHLSGRGARRQQRARSRCAAAIALAPPARPRRCRRARRRSRRRPADHPRRRDRAIAARLHRADPARRRPRPAERPGRHHQRPRLQRLRHGRPAHLHQCRRAVRRQDAERDHRRARARDRPHGRRPSVAAARAARQRADRLDHRHAARRRRRGRRRAQPAAAAAMPAAARSSAPQEAIQRSLLSYVRTQEDQADRAGVKFLTATGQSAEGHVRHRSSAWPTRCCSVRATSIPICRSHPMPAERVAALEALAKTSPYWDKKDPPELQAAPRPDARQAVRLPRAPRHGRAPLSARATTACRRATPAPSSTYRHARSAQRARADRRLIQAQPNNPYFHELKGQALLEGGQPGRSDRAAAPRGRSSRRNAPLIQIMLAQALIATDNAKHADEAVALLRTALRARAGSAGRLHAARHGLWPQGRPRRRPISPPRRPPSRAATSRPRASLPRAPRPASRSARPAGCRPTISSAVKPPQRCATDH